MLQLQHERSFPRFLKICACQTSRSRGVSAIAYCPSRQVTGGGGGTSRARIPCSSPSHSWRGDSTEEGLPSLTCQIRHPRTASPRDTIFQTPLPILRLGFSSFPNRLSPKGAGTPALTTPRRTDTVGATIRRRKTLAAATDGPQPSRPIPAKATGGRSQG